MAENSELGLPWVTDPDDRDGMEWNVHIVQISNPNMRVAFMANSPHTAIRAAHLVLAANHHHKLVEAPQEAERFMDYFAGDRTSFEGSGTPMSCLTQIREALAALKETSR